MVRSIRWFCLLVSFDPISSAQNKTQRTKVCHLDLPYRIHIRERCCFRHRTLAVFFHVVVGLDSGIGRCVCVAEDGGILGIAATVDHRCSCSWIDILLTILLVVVVVLVVHSPSHHYHHYYYHYHLYHL